MTLLSLLQRLLAPALLLLAIYFQARALSFGAAHAACPTWATIPPPYDVTSAPAEAGSPGPSASEGPAEPVGTPPAPRDPSAAEPRVSRLSQQGAPREVPRSRAFTKLPARPASVARRSSPTAGLSFVPERQDGSLRGFRIRGVRPGSVAELVGLEEGDRVDDIDGHDLSRPEGALQAYSRFRNAPDVRVNITRDGQPMTLIYRFK